MFFCHYTHNGYSYTGQTNHANGIDINGDDSFEAGEIVHQKKNLKKSDGQKIASIELAAYLDEYIYETRIKNT